MTRWKTYMAGQELPSAGLTIINIRYFGRNQVGTTYDVKYHCCDGTGTLSHDIIKNRESKNPKSCINCKNIKPVPKTYEYSTVKSIDTKAWPATVSIEKQACTQGHTWEFIRCRPCPCVSFDVNCSQPVFECSICGEIDYGRSKGPGLQDCIKEDLHNRCPIHIIDRIRRNNK